MTTPAERTRAVVQTRRFLRELLDSKLTPDVPQAIRREAKRLYRHFPMLGDMQLAHLACPSWFGPEINPENDA